MGINGLAGAGAGGNSDLGRGGPAVWGTIGGITASGTGGGGGGASSTSGVGGGGAGEVVEFWVYSPGATSYAVGAGGTSGTGTYAGGAGGAGGIFIEEFPF